MIELRFGLLGKWRELGGSWEEEGEEEGKKEKKGSRNEKREGGLIFSWLSNDS